MKVIGGESGKDKDIMTGEEESKKGMKRKITGKGEWYKTLSKEENVNKIRKEESEEWKEKKKK